MHETTGYSKQGQFFYKYGPAHQKLEIYCRQKLCFSATDLEFLIKVLDSLVEQDDCYFVKYGAVPRDNMFLGRCFFSSKENIWQQWAKLKNHPKLFCSVQNDEEAAQYRSEVASWKERDPLEISEKS